MLLVGFPYATTGASRTTTDGDRKEKTERAPHLISMRGPSGCCGAADYALFREVMGSETQPVRPMLRKKGPSFESAIKPVWPLIFSSKLRKGEYYRWGTHGFHKSGGKSFVVKRRIVDLEETDSLLTRSEEPCRADLRG